MEKKRKEMQRNSMENRYRPFKQTLKYVKIYVFCCSRILIRSNG